MSVDGGRLRERTWVTGGTACVLAVGMVLLGMEPRLVLVAFITLAVATTAFLVADLGSVAVPLVWNDPGRDDAGAARPDGRVRVLRSRLRRNASGRRSMLMPGQAEPDDEIGDTLVAVIDDLLVAEHSIDRALDPAAAATLLGPELDAFMTDPATRRSMTHRRSLPRTVSLIEAL